MPSSLLHQRFCLNEMLICLDNQTFVSLPFILKHFENQVTLSRGAGNLFPDNAFKLGCFVNRNRTFISLLEQTPRGKCFIRGGKNVSSRASFFSGVKNSCRMGFVQAG